MSDKEDQMSVESEGERDYIDDVEGDVVMDDSNAIDQIAKLSMKKKESSKNEKEGKITEFKFRVIELLDTFITKSQNSSNYFIKSIVPLLQTIQENANEIKNLNYVNKLCLLIRKYLDKTQEICEEAQEHLDQAIINSIFIAARIRTKSIFANFQRMIFSLIALKLKQNNNKQAKEFVLERINDALAKFALKKDIYYPGSFFKEFIKNQSELSIQLLPQIIQYCNLKENGGSRSDFNRKDMVEIFHFYLQNKQTKEDINLLITENRTSIQSLFENVFTNQKNIKHKKYALLNRFANLLVDLIKLFADDQKLKKQFLQKISQPLDHWDSNDKSLMSIKNRIVKLQ